MADTWTREEISAETDASLDELDAWSRLGMLPGNPDAYPASHLERVKLIQFAASRGIPPEELAELSKAQGDLLGTFVDSLGNPQPTATFSLEEGAAKLGVEPDLLERIQVASNLRGQVRFTEDDLRAAESAVTAIRAGMPDDAVLQVIRVMADASGRITDAASRLFHLYVHEALRAQGTSGPELLAETHAISAPLRDILEPTVMYFHRRAWEQAVREDFLVHLTEASAEQPSVPGQVVRTILFTDLAGFTPMTEAMGDTAAAGVVDRFSELVRDAVARHHGQILKQIGDEFMVIFSDARAAVSCGLDIERATTIEVNFPAVRSGAHTGPILYREADYVGSNVNLAARVVGEAKGHELLVTHAVREAAHGLDEVTFTFAGRRDLKGVPKPVDLYSVEHQQPMPARVRDPVCGMELDPERAAAELTWAGKRHWFCSPGCLQKFTAAPERYVN